MFTDNENILLCKRTDPKFLADAILKLKAGKELRRKIKLKGYKIFQNYCSIEALGKSLIK